MNWKEGFIAVDWGTTNRRAYLLDGAGALTDEMEDDRGVLALKPGEFPAAVEALRTRLGDTPLLLAGMVGSNRGWVEVPYVPAPAGLEDLAAALCWVEPGRTAIVPGVSYALDGRADVMRGEEVQLLGAHAARLVKSDALVCHPGTHNKWVWLEGGRIGPFRTVMTGELFNLLREHSILADLLSAPVEPGLAFEAGVRHGFAENDLTAELFSVRARCLLDKADPADAASYASGLLIGSDIRIGLGAAPSAEVAVLGRPELTGLFAAALAAMGREAREIDGEQAFLAGARRIVEAIG